MSSQKLQNRSSLQPNGFQQTFQALSIYQQTYHTSPGKGSETAITPRTINNKTNSRLSTPESQDDVEKYYAAIHESTNRVTSKIREMDNITLNIQYDSIDNSGTSTIRESNNKRFLNDQMYRAKHLLPMEYHMRKLGVKQVTKAIIDLNENMDFQAKHWGHTMYEFGINDTPNDRIKIKQIPTLSVRSEDANQDDDNAPEEDEVDEDDLDESHKSKRSNKIGSDSIKSFDEYDELDDIMLDYMNEALMGDESAHEFIDDIMKKCKKMKERFQLTANNLLNEERLRMIAEVNNMKMIQWEIEEKLNAMRAEIAELDSSLKDQSVNDGEVKKIIEDRYRDTISQLRSHKETVRLSLIPKREEVEVIRAQYNKLMQLIREIRRKAPDVDPATKRRASVMVAGLLEGLSAADLQKQEDLENEMLRNYQMWLKVYEKIKESKDRLVLLQQQSKKFEEELSFQKQRFDQEKGSFREKARALRHQDEEVSKKLSQCELILADKAREERRHRKQFNQHLQALRRQSHVISDTPGLKIAVHLSSHDEEEVAQAEALMKAEHTHDLMISELKDEFTNDDYINYWIEKLTQLESSKGNINKSNQHPKPTAPTNAKAVSSGHHPRPSVNNSKPRTSFTSKTKSKGKKDRRLPESNVVPGSELDGYQHGDDNHSDADHSTPSIMSLNSKISNKSYQMSHPSESRSQHSVVDPQTADVLSISKNFNRRSKVKSEKRNTSITSDRKLNANQLKAVSPVQPTDVAKGLEHRIVENDPVKVPTATTPEPDFEGETWNREIAEVIIRMRADDYHQNRYGTTSSRGSETNRSSRGTSRGKSSQERTKGSDLNSRDNANHLSHVQDQTIDYSKPELKPTPCQFLIACYEYHKSQLMEKLAIKDDLMTQNNHILTKGRPHVTYRVSSKTSLDPPVVPHSKIDKSGADRNELSKKGKLDEHLNQQGHGHVEIFTFAEVLHLLNDILSTCMMIESIELVIGKRCQADVAFLLRYNAGLIGSESLASDAKSNQDKGTGDTQQEDTQPFFQKHQVVSMFDTISNPVDVINKIQRCCVKMIESIVCFSPKVIMIRNDRCMLLETFTTIGTLLQILINFDHEKVIFPRCPLPTLQAEWLEGISTECVELIIGGGLTFNAPNISATLDHFQLLESLQLIIMKLLNRSSPLFGDISIRSDKLIESSIPEKDPLRDDSNPLHLYLSSIFTLLMNELEKVKQQSDENDQKLEKDIELLMKFRHGVFALQLFLFISGYQIQKQHANKSFSSVEMDIPESVTDFDETQVLSIVHLGIYEGELASEVKDTDVDIHNALQTRPNKSINSMICYQHMEDILNQLAIPLLPILLVLETYRRVLEEEIGRQSFLLKLSQLQPVAPLADLQYLNTTIAPIDEVEMSVESPIASEAADFFADGEVPIKKKSLELQLSVNPMKVLADEDKPVTVIERDINRLRSDEKINLTTESLNDNSQTPASLIQSENYKKETETKKKVKFQSMHQVHLHWLNEMEDRIKHLVRKIRVLVMNPPWPWSSSTTSPSMVNPSRNGSSESKLLNKDSMVWSSIPPPKNIPLPEEVTQSVLNYIEKVKTIATSRNDIGVSLMEAMQPDYEACLKSLQSSRDKMFTVISAWTWPMQKKLDWIVMKYNKALHEEDMSNELSREFQSQIIQHEENIEQLKRSLAIVLKEKKTPFYETTKVLGLQNHTEDIQRTILDHAANENWLKLSILKQQLANLKHRIENKKLSYQDFVNENKALLSAQDSGAFPADFIPRTNLRTQPKPSSTSNRSVPPSGSSYHRTSPSPTDKLNSKNRNQSDDIASQCLPKATSPRTDSYLVITSFQKFTKQAGLVEPTLKAPVADSQLLTHYLDMQRLSQRLESYSPSDVVNEVEQYNELDWKEDKSTRKSTALEYDDDREDGNDIEGIASAALSMSKKIVLPITKFEFHMNKNLRKLGLRIYSNDNRRVLFPLPIVHVEGNRSTESFGEGFFDFHHYHHQIQENGSKKLRNPTVHASRTSSHYDNLQPIPQKIFGFGKKMEYGLIPIQPSDAASNLIDNDTPHQKAALTNPFLAEKPQHFNLRNIGGGSFQTHDIHSSEQTSTLVPLEESEPIRLDIIGIPARKSIRNQLQPSVGKDPKDPIGCVAIDSTASSIPSMIVETVDPPVGGSNEGNVKRTEDQKDISTTRPFGSRDEEEESASEFGEDQIQEIERRASNRDYDRIDSPVVKKDRRKSTLLVKRTQFRSRLIANLFDKEAAATTSSSSNVFPMKPTALPNQYVVSIDGLISRSSKSPKSPMSKSFHFNEFEEQKEFSELEAFEYSVDMELLNTLQQIIDSLPKRSRSRSGSPSTTYRGKVIGGFGCNEAVTRSKYQIIKNPKTDEGDLEQIESTMKKSLVERSQQLKSKFHLKDWSKYTSMEDYSDYNTLHEVEKNHVVDTAPFKNNSSEQYESIATNASWKLRMEKLIRSNHETT